MTAKELPGSFAEETKSDETLFAKLMDGIKKIREKLTDGSQTVEAYAKILLEFVDKSAPFGTSFADYAEKWIKDTIEANDRALLAKQQEIANIYEKIFLKIIMADLKILLEQYVKKMCGCLLEPRKL